MSEEEADFYKKLRVDSDRLQAENSRFKRFKINIGWGDELTYQASCVEKESKMGALCSNHYKAVNHSIAIEKALMLVPDGYLLFEVLVLPRYPVYRDGEFFDGTKTLLQIIKDKK